jgi:hypothetical protein
VALPCPDDRARPESAGRVRQRPPDQIDNAFKGVKNVLVPESENQETTSNQRPAALLVVVNSICVLAAVDLDDQAHLEAREVSVVRPYGMLSPELEPQ